MKVNKHSSLFLAFSPPWKSRAAVYSWEGWALHKMGDKGELKFRLGSIHQATPPREKRASFSELYAVALAAALEKPEPSKQRSLSASLAR